MLLISIGWHRLPFPSLKIRTLQFVPNKHAQPTWLVHHLPLHLVTNYLFIDEWCDIPFLLSPSGASLLHYCSRTLATIMVPVTGWEVLSYYRDKTYRHRNYEWIRLSDFRADDIGSTGLIGNVKWILLWVSSFYLTLLLTDNRSGPTHLTGSTAYGIVKVRTSCRCARLRLATWLVMPDTN